MLRLLPGILAIFCLRGSFNLIFLKCLQTESDAWRTEVVVFFFFFFFSWILADDLMRLTGQE